MTDPLRELHRIIDARITQTIRDTQPEFIRGTVTSVETGSLSAALDGGHIPTPGITVPTGQTPAVGNDIIVVRRRDGLLVLFAILPT